MKRLLGMATGLLVLISLGSITTTSAVESTLTSSGFCDYFNNLALDTRWNWVDPLGYSTYSLAANPGYLWLYAPDGERDLYSNLDAPRMVQPITGNFVVRTRLTVEPAYSYQAAGLLVWQDSDNYIRLEKGPFDGIQYAHRIAGVYFDLNPDPTTSQTTLYLQIVRTGNTFVASFSENGSSWQEVSSVSFSAANMLQVGVSLLNQWQDNPFSASFDYFELEHCASSPIVDEARLDISMPYSTDRGCGSPYVGCGGPYHGFYRGVCTDLVLDAYNFGIPISLQNALSQDHRNHPGRYRYGTARNAEDMRRYLIHNQQFLPGGSNYQAGDIVFFDWNSNGLSNHAAVISEVDGGGQPMRMVDATGVYAGNPSGRALEHNWSGFYTQKVQGHGRLSYGVSASSVSTESLQVLQVTVDSTSVGLFLEDSNGKHISEVYDENLVATGNEKFIPYIPGGTYTSTTSGSAISVTWPLSNTSEYFVNITGKSAVEYHLDIETVQDGLVTASSRFTETISPGETHGVSLQLSAPGGVISLTVSSPTPAASVEVSPSVVTLTNLNVRATFTITSQQSLSGISVGFSDLMGQAGEVVLGESLLATPSEFGLSAGGSQTVQITTTLESPEYGMYQGNILIVYDGRSLLIPFSLTVEPSWVFLPLVLREY